MAAAPFHALLASQLPAAGSPRRSGGSYFVLRSGRTFAIDAGGGEGLVALFINSETTEFMVQIVMEAVKPFLLPEEIKGEPQAHKTVLSWGVSINLICRQLTNF